MREFEALRKKKIKNGKGNKIRCKSGIVECEPQATCSTNIFMGEINHSIGWLIEFNPGNFVQRAVMLIATPPTQTNKYQNKKNKFIVACVLCFFFLFSFKTSKVKQKVLNSDQNHKIRF